MTAAVPESTFTPVRPDCPHPEYWHAADGDSAEVEVTELVAAFVRALQPEVVLETGTAFGQTAEAIGRALAANGHGHLLTYEPDPERAQVAIDRVAGLPVIVVQAPSLAPNGQEHPGDGRPIDFAWFDSLVYLREAEFRAYHHRLVPGSVVGFHDTGPQHTVRPAVERLAAESLLRPIFLPTPRGVAFVEVL